MNLYPIMLNIEGRLVAVIGGGEVALRKIHDLVAAGARVRVVSPVINQGIYSLMEEQGAEFEIMERVYRQGDLSGAALVISATDDPDVNRMVYEEACSSNIFINAADDPPNCSFYVPAAVRKGELLVTISTGGASPAYASRLRRQIENVIPAHTEKMLCVLRECRELLKSDSAFTGLNFTARGELLKRIVNSDSLCDEMIADYDRGELRGFLMRISGLTGAHGNPDSRDKD